MQIPSAFLHDLVKVAQQPRGLELCSLLTTGPWHMPFSLLEDSSTPHLAFLYLVNFENSFRNHFFKEAPSF